MSKSMVIWLVLALMGTGCAAMETMLGNLTSPAAAEQAGQLVQAGAEISGLSKPAAAGLGGAATALIGLIGSFFADKRANKRKRGEQWKKIGELEKKVNGGTNGGASPTSGLP